MLKFEISFAVQKRMFCLGMIAAKVWLWSESCEIFTFLLLDIVLLYVSISDYDIIMLPLRPTLKCKYILCFLIMPTCENLTIVHYFHMS